MGTPVTKEVLLLESSRVCNFVQTLEFVYGNAKLGANGQIMKVSDGTTNTLDNPVNWRANGKLQTWKRHPEKFKLPIKHGLFAYGYITEENCHLFEVA